MENLSTTVDVPQNRWFIWNGIMSERALVRVVARTLRAVFRKAGVEGAHAHRFRHTLATEILARGGTEQDCADVLGISASVVRNQYAKWSQARQQRITNLFQAHLSGHNLGTRRKSAASGGIKIACNQLIPRTESY